MATSFYANGCHLQPEQAMINMAYKPTDTVLIINYHAIAPRRYKRSVVTGLVHRIFRACTDWELFDESLARAKQTLEHNQYPPEFYNPIISSTTEKLVCPTIAANNDTTASSNSSIPTTIPSTADSTKSTVAEI